VTEHAQRALVGDRLAGEQPHGRRLARAVGAEQAEADAARDVEVEPVHGRDRAEPLDHALEFDRRHRPSTLEKPALDLLAKQSARSLSTRTRRSHP
jgi:hypothetical protein